jgi:hypothetical protein
MEAIELVVKISKEDYERLKEYKKAPFCSLTSRAYEAIANGTPLPKGHGRLIDADEMKTMKNIQSANFNAVELIRYWIDNQITIIEADKEDKK